MTAIATILGLVGILALIGFYLYKAGVTSERQRGELEAYREAERIDEKTKKDGEDIDKSVTDRRTYIRNWVRKMQAYKDHDAK